ncbi:hypothetical protein [Microcoleus sp. B4-C1]
MPVPPAERLLVGQAGKPASDGQQAFRPVPPAERLWGRPESLRPSD